MPSLLDGDPIAKTTTYPNIEGATGSTTKFSSSLHSRQPVGKNSEGGAMLKQQRGTFNPRIGEELKQSGD